MGAVYTGLYVAFGVKRYDLSIMQTMTAILEANTGPGRSDLDPDWRREHPIVVIPARR